VGGKTGVDTPAGKNLIGAFHQPRVVIADVDTLATLPRNQLAAGMAEALKHGAIADRAYFERLLDQRERIFGRDRETLTAVVARSVEIKAHVVAEDEREHGRRAVLNFGHTVGHAVEAVAGFAVLHGEAVAMGMVVEAGLGVALGVTDAEDARRIRAAVEQFSLPVELPTDANPKRLLEVMRHDKKSRDHVIRASLIRRIGEPARGVKGEWTTPISEDAASAALASAG
jgi:3-dehydroquinate synthase